MIPAASTAEAETTRDLRVKIKKKRVRKLVEKMKKCKRKAKKTVMELKIIIIARPERSKALLSSSAVPGSSGLSRSLGLVAGLVLRLSVCLVRHLRCSMRKICHCEFVIVVLIFSAAVASAAEHVQSMHLCQMPMIMQRKANVPVLGCCYLSKASGNFIENDTDVSLRVPVPYPDRSMHRKSDPARSTGQAVRDPKEVRSRGVEMDGEAPRATD